MSFHYFNQNSFDDNCLNSRALDWFRAMINENIDHDENCNAR